MSPTRHLSRRQLLQAGLAASALAIAPHVIGQEPFPNKRIRLLVGFQPGGIVDTLARLLAERLQKNLGQPVVVENRPGAGANLATGLVARAKGDPYTLLLGSSGPLAISPIMESNLGFDPLTDLTPISLIAKTPLVVVVSSASPHRELAALTQALRKTGQDVLYPTPGVGSPQLLAQEAYRQRAGFPATPVHFNSSPPAILSILSGEMPFTIENPLLVLPQIRAGKMRALAVTSRQRAPLLPEVPTMIESGYDDFEAGGWYSLMAPAGIPTDVVNRLHTETLNALREPEMARRIADMASPNISSTPEELRAWIVSEMQRWRSVLSGGAKKS